MPNFYEVTPWRTVGGASGNYELESPWDTPAELILNQVSGNSAGIVLISFDDLGDLSLLLTTPAQGIPTPGWRGMLLFMSANTPYIFPFDPIPVENRRVYVAMQVTSGGDAIYITAHWRRLAPESGSYAHSAANLAATQDMVMSPQQTREAAETWTDNLATDNSSVSMQQSRHPAQSSRLRRSNSGRKPTVMERLAGK